MLGSSEQLLEAGIVADQVEGVKSIHNNLIVKGVVAPPTAAVTYGSPSTESLIKPLLSAPRYRRNQPRLGL